VDPNVEAPAGEGAARATRRGWRERAAAAATGAIGAVSGIAPHVLHHAGPIAGAALLAGTAGTLLFGVIGLVASVPFLIRLHRRFGTWRAPAIALALFVVVFTISATVVGPAIRGDDTGNAPAGATTPAADPHGH
jgi:hypothetical protein